MSLNNNDENANPYKDYRKRYFGRETRLDKADFRAAVNLFNKKVIDAIIFDSFEFKILKLGTLSLRKRKQEKFMDGKINERLPIDWINTKKYKKTVYLMNEHSDGYRYLFDFKRVTHSNKNYYKFHTARSVNRYLAKILKNPDIYGKVDAYLK